MLTGRKTLESYSNCWKPPPCLKDSPEESKRGISHSDQKDGLEESGLKEFAEVDGAKLFGKTFGLRAFRATGCIFEEPAGPCGRRGEAELTLAVRDQSAV